MNLVLIFKRISFFISRDYLRTRSVLTAPPEDTSFTSHSDDFDSSHEIEELVENQLSSSLLYCLDGNRPEVTNDSSNIDTCNESKENQEITTHANDDNNAPTLATLKAAAVGNISSSSGSSNSSNSTTSNSSISTNSRSKTSYSHLPLITSNRLANNPFVILNNARKRAATQDLDKISSTLFNCNVQLPTFSSHTSYQTRLIPANQSKTATKPLNSPNYKQHRTMDDLMISSNSSSNKENCENHNNYMVTKKLLISEYPGETSF